MRLIHCSDLHLDSKMESNLPPEKARERGNELCRTFLRLVNYGEEHGVSVVLIAGDLFDSERCSAKTAAIVLDGIRKAKGIDFLYLRGNHDESGLAFAGQELPENLKLFSNHWSSYRYGSVVISGIEFDGENDSTLYQDLKLDSEDCNLVVLHGQTSSSMGAEQVCLPALRGKGIDYLALGHLHSYQVQALDQRGTCCYSGCLEGRGFDECGEKGFVLLEITGSGRVDARFVPFAGRTLHELPVDITGLTTVPELSRGLRRAAEGIDPGDLIKFVLTGACTLDTQKDLDYLEAELNEDYYFVKIKDESSLRLHPEDYARDISLKGAFVRLVLEGEESGAEKERIIRCGIQALSGEEIGL